MKQVARYDGQMVNAYQAADLVAARLLFAQAQDIWYQAWQNQGGEDIGSCCGGKAIRVYFIGKGCRRYEMQSVVPCSFVQGNIAASRSVQPALDFLADNGIEAEYYDGWMD